MVVVQPFLGMAVFLAFGAIRLFDTSYVKDINQFQSVYSFLIGPMYFFSGTYYPIDGLPQAIKALSQLSPGFHDVCLAQTISLGKPTEKL